MRIHSCEIENFVSYRRLKFDFDDNGLVLIHGSTGSGKSTLCDVLPWILFGITAKDGAVDEVIAWNKDGPTVGSICLEWAGNELVIFRSRGGSKSDLYYRLNGSLPIRGKDINDTQLKINAIINSNSSTFLASTYYNENSISARFFTATAKQRRQLFENIVDLNLIKTITTNLTESKHTISQNLIKLINSEEKYDVLIRQSESDIKNLTQLKLKFEQTSKSKIQEDILKLKQSIEDYIQNLKIVQTQLNDNKTQSEVIQQDLAILSKEKCKSCGNPIKNSKSVDLQDKYNILYKERTKLASTKDYIEEHISLSKEQIIELETRSEENPYIQLIEDKTNQWNKHIQEQKNITQQAHLLSDKLNDLTDLENILIEARKTQINNTVSNIEAKVNQYLSEYFDSEFVVSFDIKASDKIDVVINKDANNCSFNQLSKGQKQIFKLCFGIAVMEVLHNTKFTSLNIAFFDEALDGMDDDFKSKAFNLFNSLQDVYQSIYIVEHSADFKTKFTTKYNVTITNGESRLNGET